ncbi:CRISPR-associated helicase/endonuclease Cas3 [Methylomonas koyamae]|uniref:CRISPR-associated helicase/endonuclease Cas3 n=1 Tax=Methylomonas koyamae TaxID=702114 RepID=UPI0028735F29|nr:CRISPR-associated helicase/endonuclease Cas3 [Methylomonas koyamae]WNB74759.1 CRISPR-associated helicase/endonuclease Cas3 [Methylomonas koyamae]
MAESASYYRYWGKAKPEAGDGPVYHLLPYHCLDVAAVASCWWEHSKSLRQQFTQSMQMVSEEQAKTLVLFFVALHDLGKLDIRFQSKAQHALSNLQPDASLKNAGEDYYHGPAGYGCFVLEYLRYGIEFGNEDAAFDWLQQVAGHHGVIPDYAEFINPAFVDESIIQRDQQARIDWISDLAELFQIDLNATLESVPPMLAGFCSVCDWIGSSEYFPYESTPNIPLSSYLESRRAQAEEALTAFGIFAQLKTNKTLETLFPGYIPQGLQTLVEQLPLQQNLTLIEAPTGSGKTETALVYAAKMLHAGLAESIIFALPTQATANAMLDRLEKMADHLFKDGANVVLAHGKSSLQQSLQTINRVTAQGWEEANQQAIRWLTASKKRAFLGQIGVCTIDQVLLSVLPVKHKFVRGFGIQKSLLIVDEVHAYDSYMYGLLGKVLQQQYQAGGSVLLLSATLPQKQREDLAANWNNSAVPETDVYPLITQIYRQKSLETFAISDIQQLPKSREVLLETWRLPELKFDESSLRRIIDAAKQGAKVAVICNLVADAQLLVKRLADAAIDTQISVDLFHSRYRFVDRQYLEDAVKKLYGKDNSKRAQGGRILVATQVIEQSLDLDFDWLITQLCPVDLLFQRMGRLHRHDRPGHERPQNFRSSPSCVVIVPEQPLDYGHTGKYVYQNTRVLWRTEQLINSPSVAFPQAYRDWIGKVYKESPWENEPAAITEAADKYQREVDDNKRRIARLVTEYKVNPLPDDSDKATTLTRDGEMGLTVLPVIVEGGQRLTLEGELLDKSGKDYWELLSLHGVPVPSSWSGLLLGCLEDGVYFLPMQPDGEQWQVAINGQAIYYSKVLGLWIEK